MERCAIKSTAFSANCASGYTLLELLVASLLGLLLAAMILSTMNANRNLYKKDLVRTRINQNLRGVMDIIGGDLRLAGENLGPYFPALEVTNSASGDVLIIRRNLVAEVPQVCKAISANSTSALSFAVPGTTPGCIYSGETTTYNAWRSYRQTHDNSVEAFAWNPSTKRGEFFMYTSETDNGSTYTIKRSGKWTNAYPIGGAAYILEEWRFELIDDTLQLVRNQHFDAPVDLAYQIQNFQVRIVMQDDTVLDSFDASDGWTMIKSVQISLTGEETFEGKDFTRTLTTRFFPRNILSN